MQSILVKPIDRLFGSIDISGAKNAALPIIAASLLFDRVLLENVPNLSDVQHMRSLIHELGARSIFIPKNISDIDSYEKYDVAKSSRSRAGEITPPPLSSSLDNTFVNSEPINCYTPPFNIDTIINNKYNNLFIDSSYINNFTAPYDIASKMRASIWILGPLLSRYGEAKIFMPGGCKLGSRQIDMHIDGLRKMGADIDVNNEYIFAKAPKGLHGVDFHFPKVSVGATINILMACVYAKSTTKLSNCALEPEVVDLCVFLEKHGVKIKGIGTSVMTIDPIHQDILLDKNHDRMINSFNSDNRINNYKDTICVKHQIIPDRIEAGTYMIAAAITKGELVLKNAQINHLSHFCDKLMSAGVGIKEVASNTILVKSSNIIHATNITTSPYPGFPTDLQAQFMTLMSVSKGSCVIEETIFENRFMHVQELVKMNANITVANQHTAVVHGKSPGVLKGANVVATDLRASASLILAGLCAKGDTRVNGIYHLDRGYEDLKGKLNACGASIQRCA